MLGERSEDSMCQRGVQRRPPSVGLGECAHACKRASVREPVGVAGVGWRSEAVRYADGVVLCGWQRAMNTTQMASSIWLGGEPRACLWHRGGPSQWVWSQRWACLSGPPEARGYPHGFGAARTPLLPRLLATFAGGSLRLDPQLPMFFAQCLSFGDGGSRRRRRPSEQPLREELA